MSDLTDVYNAMKRLQKSTVGTLRELLQSDYSAEWVSKDIDILSIETTVRRRLKVLIDLELIEKEKQGRENIYKIVHNFPVKSRAPEIMGQMEELFREDEALYSKIQKPLVELLNELKSPYYIRQNVEDISFKEEVIAKLEQAINGHNFCNVIYKQKNYHVKVLKIAEFEGIWYLLLYYDKDKSYRKYPISGIDSVQILKETFVLTQQQNLDIQSWHNVWHQPGVKPTRIKLWIDEMVVEYFYKKNIFDINAYPQRVMPCKEGIEYDVYITHIYELLPQIMYWQPNVIILEQEGAIDAKSEFLELLKMTVEQQETIL